MNALVLGVSSRACAPSHTQVAQVCVCALQTHTRSAEHYASLLTSLCGRAEHGAKALECAPCARDTHKYIPKYMSTGARACAKCAECNVARAVSGVRRSGRVQKLTVLVSAACFRCPRSTTAHALSWGLSITRHTHTLIYVRHTQWWKFEYYNITKCFSILFLVI